LGVPTSASVLRVLPVVEVELWISIAGSMALLGLLLLVLVLPWSKLGVGSGNTVSLNKSVAAGSSLRVFCCKADELLTGHCGEGERSLPLAKLSLSSPLAGRDGEEVLKKGGPILDPGVGSGLSCCSCSCSSNQLKQSFLSCHGGEEDFDDFVAAQEDLPQHLPTGCYGSIIFCAEHMASMFDVVILGRYGGQSSTSIVEASPSSAAEARRVRLPSGLVPGGLTTVVSRRSAPEGSL
jgi:hypothetical protein